MAISQPCTKELNESKSEEVLRKFVITIQHSYTCIFNAIQYDDTFLSPTS